jgi:hypothetical protein
MKTLLALSKLQKQCDDWNAKYPVGRMVIAELDSGEVRITRTRSRAQVLSDHTPVIWLESFAGAYLLTRVKAVQP